MPAGYRIEMAGAVEESARARLDRGRRAGDAVPHLHAADAAAAQLQRAMLVFLTGPLGIAGVAAALLLLNRPSASWLLGVIALMGMIMRNSVILIDQIEQDRAGACRREAIVEVGGAALPAHRADAAAAVLAMIPLSRSVFWGPMAVAIMGGLVVATVLTLLALPAMYAAWFRVRKPGGTRCINLAQGRPKNTWWLAIPR
jgi:multidrug efflux pump subunit AcrB